MSIEGIWTGEIYGPFGWETRGVFVFEKGRIVGGDNRQYTTGTYRKSGKKVTAELTIHYYGPPRTAFGEVAEKFSARIVGNLKDDEINGTIERPDRKEFDLQIRLTKRLSMPK